MFKNGLTLRKLVEMQISSEGFLNIVDPLMLPQNHASKEEECFVSVALVGLSCSIDSPYERSNMAEVFERCAYIYIYINVLLVFFYKGEKRQCSIVN